jgi:molybdate transport system permease protein
MDWSAASISLALASITTLILLPLGVLMGRWLASSASKLRPALEAALLLPLLLPPTVLGFYWLSVFGKNTAIGGAIERYFNLPLVFSFSGLLLVSMFINLPFMVQPILRSFANVDQSLREAAWVGGLSKVQTFWKIELPLCTSGIVAGAAMTFAHTLGEFGVVLLVGGNIPGSTKTLSIAIYDQVQNFDFAAAHLMSALLVGCSLIALIAVFSSNQSNQRKART